MPRLLVLVISFLVLSLWACSRSERYYLERGNRFYAEGKYEEAALNYRHSIERKSNLPEAHYRLGLADLKVGAQGSAYEEFRRAMDLAPDRDDIRIQLADLALSLYRTNPQNSKVLYDEVSRTASLLLQRNPNSFDGLRLRADVLSIDRRLDDALTTFQRANEIRPFEPGVVLPMVQVLFQLNQASEAEALAKQFLRFHKDSGPVYDVLLAHYLENKRMIEAEDLLKSKITNLPKDSYPILQLATLYRQLQREPEMTQTLQRILTAPRTDPRGHEVIGEFYAEVGRWDDALREYKMGLRSNTTDRLLYQKKIVKVLVAQDKRDDAIEQLSQVFKENPDDLDSRLARAILLRESTDPKKLDWAVSELKALLQKVPNDAIAHYNLGLAYLAKSDPNSAKGQFKESARLRPAYIAPRKTLAVIDQRERNYSETIRLANEILAVNPEDAESRLLHAAALLGSKAYQQARNELGALLRQYPDSVDINLHMAVLDTEEKKYREAEARYHRLYKPGDKDLRPLEGLIQVYIAEKQSDKALVLLEQELKQNADSRPVHLMLASIATGAGKLDLAMQQYQWLQANDPKSPEVYRSLGDFYQLKGDVNSAVTSYQKARELTPNDPKIIAMLAYLQGASGQKVEAIANLQKQLAIDPQNTIAMNNLAFILADTSTDLDRALTLAQTAQRKASNNAGIADTLGWVYVKKGLNDSAIQIFNGLVKKYPDEPAFRYHLGVALLQKGQTAEAKSEFVISLSKKPPKDMAEKIKQILSKLG
jgi:tetratricopeptide (TPR) repeat protein